MKNKKLFIIILILLVILLLTLLGLIGRNIMNDTSNTPIYSTIESMPDVKTLINQMYGKFIKIEDSKNEKYSKDIYVKLKYDLYENDVPKKDFYNALIQNVAQMLNYNNVRIIDEDKQLEIKVVCDKENRTLIGSYINNDTNFYGHYESQKALANYKPTQVTNLRLDSNELKTLTQNNWNRKELSIGKETEKVDEYIEYPDYGIYIYDIDEKVFNLIFDTRYKGTIVNGIKVGDSLENVVSILGNPTFGNIQEGYVGYKGQELYVFFNNEQISIYPVESNNSSDLSQLVKQYESDGSIKKLVSNATDIWENYEEYYYDEYTVNLTYPLAGLKFQFGITENHGIIIYNNFTGKIFDNYTQEELSKAETEIPSYIYFVEEDSVNEYEYERYNFLRSTGEDGDFEDLEDWKYL